MQPQGLQSCEMGKFFWLCLAVSTAAIIASNAPVGAHDPVSDDAFERGRLIASGGGPGGPSAACFACHGRNGEGQAVAVVPALAGLSPQYQFKQLNDFAAGRRPSETMTAIAQKLSRADRHAVSLFYARASGRSPVPAAGVKADPQLIQDGAVLYARGVPERAVQACLNCHGPGARGIDPTYPALAGQPARYIADQLRLWRSGVRGDDGGVMRAISLQMSEHDIDAVAAYLSALAPASRAETPSQHTQLSSGGGHD